MTTAPKCSIIVTSYNIEKYIGECLTEVAGQTLGDVEIIVVDDGSTDGSRRVIDSFAERHPNITKIYFDKNTIGGVATAANAGLDAARGEWIGFADGDDRFEPDMFARLVAAAESADADLAMCGYTLLEDQTGISSEPADQRRWDALAGQDVLTLDDAGKSMLLTFIAVPWRKLYRRRMIEEHKIRFPVGDYFFEDNPFHWAVVMASNRCALVPAALCRHRISRPGQTMESADAKLFKLFQHHKTIHDTLVRTGQRERFGTDLAAWLTGQAEWISKRCQPDQQMAFLEALKPCYARHPLPEIRAALDARETSRYGAFLALAAKSGDAGFFREAFVVDGEKGIASRARFILMRDGPLRMLRRGWQFILDRVLDTTSWLFSHLFLRDINRHLAQSEAQTLAATRAMAHQNNRRLDEVITSLMILDERAATNRQIGALTERLQRLEDEMMSLRGTRAADDAAAIGAAIGDRKQEGESL